MVNGWNATCCWIRYLFVGARNGACRGWSILSLGNHFFSAMQVPSELTALGEILAARRPERALEIGTARGGTLLFLSRLASPQATIVSNHVTAGNSGGKYGRIRYYYGTRSTLLLATTYDPVKRLRLYAAHLVRTMGRFMKCLARGRPCTAHAVFCIC